MMATTLKKSRPEPTGPDYRNTGTAVEIEVATEIMMGYVGYLNTQIMNEEALAKPNKERIDAMQTQMKTVFDESNELITDRKLVTKALYVYGPIMKALIKGV